MNKQKGFTLIELLVVIAIIGILSSIVLASLNVARNKGNDAKTKGQLSSIRASTEIYFDSYNNFGTIVPTSGACTTGDLFMDVNSGTKALVTQSNYPSNTVLDCGASATAWSVAASLNGGTLTAGPAFCADSTGTLRSITAAGAPYEGVLGTTATNGAHAAAGSTVCN